MDLSPQLRLTLSNSSARVACLRVSKRLGQRDRERNGSALTGEDISVNQADTFFKLTRESVKEIVKERMKALKERNGAPPVEFDVCKDFQALLERLQGALTQASKEIPAYQSLTTEETLHALAALSALGRDQKDPPPSELVSNFLVLSQPVQIRHSPALYPQTHRRVCHLLWLWRHSYHR
jgi:hypothetical protein